MIRRPATSADRSPCWVLISQIEHARIAGELALHWGCSRSPYASLVKYSGLIEAVFHHDDGWTEWERSPTIEPDSGSPRDFLEMPLDEAMVIWERSIAAAAHFGPLAGFVVCGHFCTLLRRGMQAWHEPDKKKGRLAQEFLSAGTGYQQLALREWMQSELVANTEAAAHRALSWLQLFDRLSLWLCCRPQAELLDVPLPDAPGISLAPVNETNVIVSPWPFAAPRIELHVSGNRIPARRYQNSEDLAQQAKEPVVLSWLLDPVEHG